MRPAAQTRRHVLGRLASLAAVPAWPGSARARPSVRVGPTAGLANDALRQAIAGLPRSGGADLVFDPGTYRFGPGQGATLSFDGIEDLHVQGNGAELMFSGRGIGLSFRACRGLTVRDLVLDWPEPPFAQATATGLRDGGHTLDLSLMPGFSLDAGQAPGALHEVDPSTGLVRVDSADIYGGLRVVSAGQGVATLSSTSALTVAAGSAIVLRHQVYGGNALHVSGCTGDIEFADLTVRAAPGMALYARNCDGTFHVVRLTVGPRQGTGRWLSTNADAVHVQNCTGRVSVEQCTLQGMGDDAINVYSDYLRITQVLHRRTLAVANAGAGAVGPETLPQPDSMVTLVSGRSLQPLGLARLAAAAPGLPARMSFGTDLPGGLAAGDLVADVGRGNVEVAVSGCSFPGNRGRGVVAHGHALIERCRFRGQSRAAVFLAPDTLWLECCEVGNAVVRDNVVEDSCRSMPNDAPGAAAIAVTALIRGPGVTGTPDLVNHDVRISGNVIDGSHRQAIQIVAVRDLVVSGNRIKTPGRTAVSLDLVERASLSDNVCQPPSAIGVHATSTQAVTVTGNTGLAVHAQP